MCALSVMVAPNVPTGIAGERSAAEPSARDNGDAAEPVDSADMPAEKVPDMKRRIRIVATGSYLPRRVVPSSEIDERLGKRKGWTERVFRISQRHYADEQESSSFMAACAATQALGRAGIVPQDLDAVVAACGVGEQPIPATAVLVQNRLGLAGTAIPAFDVNATCLSFVTALDLVADAIALGRYRRVLIVSADIASCGLDWSNPEAAAIFGDGAAAAIVEAADEAHGSVIRSSAMCTFSAFKDACRLEAGGTGVNTVRGRERLAGGSVFSMDGHEAMACVAANLPGFTHDLCRRAGMTLGDIDLTILHQASARSLAAVEKMLGLDPTKVLIVFRNFGNQIATSIPHVLDRAISSGRVKRGDTVMLLGSSAGISLGGMVITY